MLPVVEELVLEDLQLGLEDSDGSNSSSHAGLRRFKLVSHDALVELALHLCQCLLVRLGACPWSAGAPTFCALLLVAFGLSLLLSFCKSVRLRGLARSFAWALRLCKGNKTVL